MFPGIFVGDPLALINSYNRFSFYLTDRSGSAKYPHLLIFL